MQFEIINKGKNSAHANMRYDEELLASLEHNPRSILHIYDWLTPSATYGYFSKPLNFLNEEALSKHGIVLAKRPTGGGIIFHQFDLAFSFLLPADHEKFSLNTLTNYSLVNSLVIEVAKPFVSSMPVLEQKLLQPQKTMLSNFCMAGITIYDVVIDGKKIAGAAQRRKKHGLLHQGSIALLQPAIGFLEDIFLPGAPFIKAIQNSGFPLLREIPEQKILALKENIIDNLMTIFHKNFTSN